MIRGQWSVVSGQQVGARFLGVVLKLKFRTLNCPLTTGH